MVVLQARPKAHRDLSNVPIAIDLAKTEEARQLIQVGIHDLAAMMRPYVFPPGTPNDRVQVLRRALLDTVKEPDFVQDAKKSRLEIEPMSGEELEKTASGLFKLSPTIVARLKEILK